MRTLLVVLLVPIFCQGQPSSSFAHKTDRFTNERSVTLKAPVLLKSGKNTAVVDFFKSSTDAMVLSISVTGPGFGCALKSHVVRFLFSDNTASEAYNSDN